VRLFKKRPYIPLESNQTTDPETFRSVPDGMFKQCPSCKKAIYYRELGENKICPHCGYTFRISVQERLQITVDAGSFEEWNDSIVSTDPLEFPGYSEKLRKAQIASGLREAIVTGKAAVQGIQTAIGVMDSHFIMGSMGQAVGEKITRLFETALAEKLPVVLFTCSGGARMQEGILSLMQMAKTSAAIANHSSAGLLYVTVLTDPTTGGVTASFAMQGDIILSEPRALVGFAGRRVIESTIKEKLPADFQQAETVLKNGFIDKIVVRTELKKTIGKILALHSPVESFQKSFDTVNKKVTQ